MRIHVTDNVYAYFVKPLSAWWCHQMETFSALLDFSAGNSPVTGEFHAQRPVTRSFDVFFDFCLNKRLSKQSWGWWFETPSFPLWRHNNGTTNHYLIQCRPRSVSPQDVTSPWRIKSLQWRHIRAMASQIASDIFAETTENWSKLRITDPLFKGWLTETYCDKFIHIVGTLGCVFIDNETHESGVTKCTTGEAWSAFRWHHSSVFHCQLTHNQVFLLLSHMLI